MLTPSLIRSELICCQNLGKKKKMNKYPKNPILDIYSLIYKDSTSFNEDWRLKYEDILMNQTFFSSEDQCLFSTCDRLSAPSYLFMYERWAVRSGVWDSVHLFPINTESMECKIDHNQNCLLYTSPSPRDY